MAFQIKTALQFFTAFKNYIISNNNTLTDWNQGSRVRTIAEAVALLAADINLEWFRSLDQQAQEAIYQTFGFGRKAGTKAQGYITFGRDEADPAQVSIASGIQIEYNGFIVITLATSTILANETLSGETLAQFSTASSETNILINAINTSLGKGAFIAKPDGVDYCKNETVYSGGTDEETDEQRVTRFQIYVNGLTRTTVQGIQAQVLAIDDVQAVTVKELDPAPGYVTIYVDEGNGLLTNSVKQEVIKVIEGDPLDKANYPGSRATGIQVIVNAPTIINVEWFVQIDVLYGVDYDIVELKNIVKTAITRSVNTLKLGSDVILSEISKRIKSADEDIYDVRFYTDAGFGTIETENITINEYQVAKTQSLLITIDDIQEVNL